MTEHRGTAGSNDRRKLTRQPRLLLVVLIGSQRIDTGGLDERQIGDPQLVRAGGGEVPVDQVRMPRRRLRRPGGADLLGAADAFGAVPSIGTVGDSYDNALAETVNGYYKAELIRGLNRPGFDGGSGYLIPTRAFAPCWVA